MRQHYRRLRNRTRRWWQMFWLQRSGAQGLGRFAAWMASLHTLPYHHRAHLASLVPHGFVAASARLSHPDLRLGEHVYLGDRVFITCNQGGGQVEFQDQVHLYGDSFIETGMGGEIRIGEGTHIQPGCHIHAYISAIHIGKQVEIAPGCGFYCYSHGIAPDRPIMEQPLHSKGRILVGDGAWIGYGVTVLQGVTIGKGAVIAAGSVVTRDIPNDAIAAGVPAITLRYRTSIPADSSVKNSHTPESKHLRPPETNEPPEDPLQQPATSVRKKT